MTLDELKEHRNEVLWWEICSILHDIGKLSDEFLRYRQDWHTMVDGWRNKDPHDHLWFEDRETLLDGFPQLKRFFEQKFPSSISGQLSVSNAVHNHTAEHVDDLVRMLKQGDGIDSQYDRNNPLIGCEQTDHQHPDRRTSIYRSNVFGYESEATKVVPGILTRARRELYQELQVLVEPYTAGSGSASRPGPIRDLSEKDYYRIRKVLRKYFRPALSDTTRPNNDTDLWEHTYSVASIAKALHIAELLGVCPLRDSSFRIWGFGFDSLRYLSFSHKIGDVIGRREVLDRIFDGAERLVEYEFPFGNVVYRDDSFLLFMVPGLPDISFEESAVQLRNEIVGRSLEISEQEIVPAFVAGVPVGTLTRIVEQIQELRLKVAIPVSQGAAELAQGIRRHWTSPGPGPRSVCSVCRIRPTRTEEENTLVCRECLRRRRNRTESFRFNDEPKPTPMISEIADGNGRAVMIVAKFGLSRWLDGTMVRASLITQPDAIARTEVALKHITEMPLGDESLRGAEAIRMRPRNDYSQMLEDLGKCRNGTGEDLLFLYGRGLVGETPRLNRDLDRSNRIWNGIVADFKHEFHRATMLSDTELLLNLISAKTPTPSSILDVWITTERFLDGIVGEREVFSQNPEQALFRSIPAVLSQEHLGLHPRSRAWFEVDRLPVGSRINERETLTAHIRGNLYEVVYEGSDNRFWFVNSAVPPEIFPAEVGLQREDDAVPQLCWGLRAVTKQRAYLPWRCISASPDLLLLLAPASKAVEITEAIYAGYREEFGKAYGRLPLSIGHIFFAQHQPMFSVLDAARRMEENFRELHARRPETLDLPVSEGELRLKLGNEQEDWHHPYVFTPRSREDRPSFFKTVEGPAVRISDLADDQQVAIHPNYYDSEFLGASAHRFRLHLASRGRQRGEGPILLEDLIGTSKRQGMKGIWDALRASGRVTDAALRNFERAITVREAVWRSGGRDKAKKAARGLAENLVANYFPSEVRSGVLRALDNDLFFRALNLYLRILKRRVREPEPLPQRLNQESGGQGAQPATT